MSGNHSTIEMIRAAQLGDKASWNLVYKQYYTGLYAIAIQRCRNLAMAEDAVQDAFITAYLKLSQLQEPAAFPGWIKKILTNICLKAAIHQHKLQSLNAVVKESLSQIDNQLENKYNWLATKGELYSGLAALPEALRATLLLRYFFSFQSYQEIAAILSVPIGTVRSRLNQAKLKLTELWHSSSDDNANAIGEVEFWNNFYLQTLAAIHHEDRSRDRFMAHFSKDARLIRPGEDTPADCSVFGKMIQDDRRAGSWLSPANIMTSGNISIIEARHFNSSKNPDHCPDVSLMIIERHQDKANKIQLHIF